jgi:phage-related protein
MMANAIIGIQAAMALMGLTLGPVLLVVAALAALAGIAFLVYQNWDTVSKFFINAWNMMKDAFGAAVDWIKDHWQLILTIMLGPIGAFIALVVTYWNQISSVAEAVFSFIWNGIIKPFLDVVTFAFNAWLATVEYILGWMKALFMLAWNWIYGVAIKPVMDAIAAGMNWLGGIVAGVWNWIAGVASAAWGGISGAAQAAWNWVTGIWNQAYGYFKGIWDGIVGAAGGIASGIGNAFGSAFDGAKNIAKSAMNWLIDKVNSVAGTINSVAGKIGAPKIPTLARLANGVRNFGGGLAMVGELGPELVTLPQGASVYSNTKSRSMIGDMASGGGSRIVNNIYMADANITSPHVADQYATLIGDGIIRRLGTTVKL